MKLYATCYCSVQRVIQTLLMLSINLSATDDFRCVLKSTCMKKQVDSVRLTFHSIKRLLEWFWLHGNFPLPVDLPDMFQHLQTEQGLAMAKEQYRLEHLEKTTTKLEKLPVSQWLTFLTASHDENHCRFTKTREYNESEVYLTLPQMKEMKAASLGHIEHIEEEGSVTLGRKTFASFLFHSPERDSELLLVHRYPRTPAMGWTQLTNDDKDNDSPHPPNRRILNWTRAKLFRCDESKSRPQYTFDADTLKITDVNRSEIVPRCFDELQKSWAAIPPLKNIAMSNVSHLIGCLIIETHALGLEPHVPRTQLCVKFAEMIETQVYPVLGFRAAKEVASNVLEIVALTLIFDQYSPFFDKTIDVHLTKDCMACSFCTV